MDPHRPDECSLRQRSFGEIEKCLYLRSRHVSSGESTDDLPLVSFVLEINDRISVPSRSENEGWLERDTSFPSI